MKNMIIMRQPSHTSTSAVMSAMQDQQLEGFIFSVALTVIFRFILTDNKKNLHAKEKGCTIRDAPSSLLHLQNRLIGWLNK